MGKSLFLFPEPLKELAPYCRKKGIQLIYDAAHVLGLIAGHQFQDPLAEGATIVTASTHKTFFGSQRGVILSNVDDEEWRKIDKGAFPGSSSNHHLETLVALAVSTYEMLEFGADYARQVVANAKHLARKLFDLGFKVQGEQFGFTESHQVAIDMTDFGGGDTAARDLKDNRIIVNMNLLPFEPLAHATSPAGIRIGVQEMTRVGMKEAEMDRIADLFKRCLMEKKFVGDDVKEMRSHYRRGRLLLRRPGLSRAPRCRRTHAARRMIRAAGKLDLCPRSPYSSPISSHALHAGKGPDMLIIGELINSTRKQIRKAIEEKDSAYIQNLAKKQAEAGANWVDVNAGAFPKRRGGEGAVADLGDPRSHVKSRCPSIPRGRPRWKRGLPWRERIRSSIPSRPNPTGTRP